MFRIIRLPVSRVGGGEWGHTNRQNVSFHSDGNVLGLYKMNYISIKKDYATKTLNGLEISQSWPSALILNQKVRTLRVVLCSFLLFEIYLFKRGGGSKCKEEGKGQADSLLSLEPMQGLIPLPGFHDLSQIKSRSLNQPSHSEVPDSFLINSIPVHFAWGPVTHSSSSLTCLTPFKNQ